MFNDEHGEIGKTGSSEWVNRKLDSFVFFFSILTWYSSVWLHRVCMYKEMSGKPDLNMEISSFIKLDHYCWISQAFCPKKNIGSYGLTETAGKNILLNVFLSLKKLYIS